MSSCYISHAMLLSKYNPFYYMQLFEEIELEINDMYHLSTSTVTDNEEGRLIILSHRVEDIALRIVERRETLERLKKAAAEHCIHLQTALKGLPSKYQVALHKAQSSMNIRLMNKNQLDDICDALWAVVDQGEDEPSESEQMLVTQSV